MVYALYGLTPEEIEIVEGKIKIMSVKLTRTKKECIVEYDINQPPDIFFDTNVWREMNRDDKTFLDELQQKRGFRYFCVL